MATTEQWRTIEGWAEHLTGVGHDPTAACLLDLRRRVEALEALEQQRAATEESSATEPSSMSNASAGLQKIQEIQEKMQEEGRTLASLFDKALEPSKAAFAPAADRPLWELMRVAWNYRGNMRPEDDWAAAIDAVAAWFDSRGCHGAAHDLRAEARRTREGA